MTEGPYVKTCPFFDGDLAQVAAVGGTFRSFDELRSVLIGRIGDGPCELVRGLWGLGVVSLAAKLLNPQGFCSLSAVSRCYQSNSI